MSQTEPTNAYRVELFMQGGRPIAVVDSEITISETGSVSEPEGRSGRWSVADDHLQIFWNGEEPERFCQYSENVTETYRGHLFNYGKVLVPEHVGFELPLPGIDDNPCEKLNGHLREHHPHARRVVSRASRDFFEIFIHGGKCLEVGVGFGNNSQRIRNHLEPAELHLVDSWQVMEGSSDLYTQKNLDEAFAATQEKFANDPSVIIHRGLSQVVLKELPRAHFDMIYIDADHTEEACYRDLLLSEPLLKADGYLCGHDYTEYPNNDDAAVARGGYGVINAVDRFCRERGWQMECLTIEVLDWCFPSYVLHKA